MTQAKHTPGPWRVGDAGTTVFGPKTDKPSPVTIAGVSHAGGDYKANARLIAAAPELLYEAIKAVALMQKAGMGFNEVGLAAAIAKATGGEA